jgi:hypothetical protein
MMKLYAIIVLQFVIRIHAFFDEYLTTQGLLGSHFGVPGLPGSFDYVVVGGGTSGLALASRLAENSSLSVAVVEAGDFYEFSNGNFSQVPASAAQFVGSNPKLKNPFLDWYQYTTKQKVCLA